MNFIGGGFASNAAEPEKRGCPLCDIVLVWSVPLDNWLCVKCGWQPEKPKEEVRQQQQQDANEPAMMNEVRESSLEAIIPITESRSTQARKRRSKATNPEDLALEQKRICAKGIHDLD